MPSPFPGMNPYLERDSVWNDFRSEYCLGMRKALVTQVQPDFYVKINERRYERKAPDEELVPYLEIFDKADDSLVSVIELLSPSNKKKGPDRDQFLAKRLQLLKRDVHYVEIDLLRGGPRLPIEGMPECDYYVLVSRFEERPGMGFWPVKLREPLPLIPIPLKGPKREVRIPLQELLHQAYDEAGYAGYIYSGPPSPALREEDDAWAKQLVVG